MADVLCILAALLLGFLILHFLKQFWSRRNYPPGPLPLPVIGSMYQFIRNGLSEDSLVKMAKKYGNIFTIWLGNHPIVILCGYETVKESLINHSENFADRPLVNIVTNITNKKGISFSNGHNWKQQRHFGKITLRKLGVGTQSIEHQVEEEAHQLLESILRLNGLPFDPSLLITNSITNLICALVFGQRFSFDDKDFQMLIEALTFMLKFASSIFNLLQELFPWLMKQLPGPHKKALYFTELAKSYVKKQIWMHKEQLALNEPKDFIDFYLLQMEKSKDDPNSTYSEENLAACILDFFIAGSNTSITSLLWALLLMAGHPDIQEKVHKEIEDVLGSSPSVSYKDRKKLPYTNAVLHETQRSRYALLYGIPRQCSQDVNIFGFHVPKGAYVVPDLYSVLTDPKQWEQPQEFNPQHFLDKNGNFVTREEFLAFGAGVRACVGEQLGRAELFIFFTSLMKEFTFKLPEGVKEINKKPIFGLATRPHPYKLCAVPRCGALV